MEYDIGQPVEYEGPNGDICTGHVVQQFFGPWGVKYIVEDAYGSQSEAYGCDLEEI